MKNDDYELSGQILLRPREETERILAEHARIAGVKKTTYAQRVLEWWAHETGPFPVMEAVNNYLFVQENKESFERWKEERQSGFQKKLDQPE